jgi:ATP-binding cassette subfamily F protein uup
MDHLVDQLFVFEGDGSLRIFNGNYSDYRNWVDESERQLSTESPRLEEKQPVSMPRESKRKLTFKEKQEFEQLQSQISVLERERDGLTEKLSTGEQDHMELQLLSERIQRVNEEIDTKTIRWIELSELAD